MGLSPLLKVRVCIDFSPPSFSRDPYVINELPLRGDPLIASHEFQDFFTPPPSLSQVTFLRPPLPSVTSHILQFYT